METITTENHIENTSPPREDSTFSVQDFFRENLVRSNDNKLVIAGDNHNPMELALLEIEIKRRGEQSATSREKARADRSELELSKVKENVRGVVKQPEIDPQLKYSDPDEYIKQTLAAQSNDPYQEAFTTARTQATQEVGQITMDNMIQQHNLTNPDRIISEDMLTMDLPPRLVNDFSNGKLSPQDFLSTAANILYKPTGSMNQPTLDQPNIGNVGGQTTPTDTGSNDKAAANYANAVF